MVGYGYTSGVFVPSNVSVSDGILKLKAVSKESTAGIESKNANYLYGYYEIRAQDILKVFPNLVKVSNDSAKTLTVNYIGLIPVLIEAIKEQQSKIEELQNELKIIKHGEGEDNFFNNMDKQSKKGVIYQNIPNPFTHKTSIKYSIYKSFNTASIKVFNLSGKQISVYKLNANTNTIDILSEGLNAGIYLYCLIVDGIITDTKRMIIQ